MDEEDAVTNLRNLLAALDQANSTQTRISSLQNLQQFLSQQGEENQNFILNHAHDEIIDAIRNQLKNGNPLVSAKVLAILPSIIDLSTNYHDNHSLHRVRYVMQVLLPALIASLGDQRDRSREASKGCIVQIAKAVSHVTPIAIAAASAGHMTLAKSAHETPFTLFERIIIDSGLTSKVAKVKEQMLLLMPILRQSSERFPLKPFLPFLVDLLSDADSNVREASRSTVFSLFSNAKPTAKAELKKEMDKKGTRRQTADSILEQIFANNASNTISESIPSTTIEDETNDRKHTSMIGLPSALAVEETGAGPSSRSASRSASRMGGRVNDGESNSDIRAIYVATSSELEKMFAAMLPHFAGKETEHNWQAREQSVLKIRGMLKTSTYQSYQNVFPSCIRNLSEGILKAVASLRTTLSIHGITLVSELAQQMGDDLEGQAETFLTPLIRMAGFTKKIVASASQSAVGEILKNVSYRHKYLELVAQGLLDKNFGTRTAMCQHLDTILSVHGKHRKHALESHGGLDTITKFCKKSLADPNKDVRSLARIAFYRVEQIWPSTARSIFESLDSNTQKQVESNRSSANQTVPQTPATSRIAASTISTVATPRTPNNRVGPSSAILAAKRAAAASLRKEKQEREQIQVRKTPDDDKFVADEGEEDLLSSPSVGEMSEEELHSTPPLVIRRKPARSPSPIPPSKSPLRSRNSSDSTTSPRIQPSSIPLPSSPVGNRSASRNETSRPTSSIVGVRSRTTSTSSASSNLSAGRFSARGGTNYGSIAQRFDQQSTTTVSSAAKEVKSRSPPPESGRKLYDTSTKTSKTSYLPQADLSADDLDRSVQVSPPSSPSRIPTRSLPHRPDLVSKASKDVEGEANTTALSAMSLTSPARPESDASTEFGSPSSPSSRSRLPRPVSMLPSPSSKENVGLTSRHSYSLSNDATPSLFNSGKPAKIRSTQPPANNGNHTSLNEDISNGSKASVNVAEERAPVTRTLVSGDASSSVKWFLGKAARLDNTAINDQEVDFVDLSPVKRRPESDTYIGQLHENRASLRTFKGLVSLSKEFKLPRRNEQGTNEDEPPSALGLETDAEANREYQIAIAMWQEGNLFDRIFVALCSYLRSEGVILATSLRDLQTAALVSLHRLVENQFGLFSALDRERDLLDLLLDLVKKNHSGPSTAGVKSACQAIADRWADQTDVIIGVTTLRIVLSNWLSVDEHEGTGQTNVDDSSPSTVAMLTLSLRTLARLFGRLPAELVEEQMEHCSMVVKRGLHHRQIETRQQAVNVLVAANGKIRDPQSLFGILQPIDKAQQDLLIYYMNRA